jgi:hypothetical protein
MSNGSVKTSKNSSEARYSLTANAAPASLTTDCSKEKPKNAASIWSPSSAAIGSRCGGPVVPRGSPTGSTV